MGYCITDFQTNDIKGACWVPGKKSIQSSYCSELAGILTTLKRTEQLCREKVINQGHLTIACNNIAAGLSLQTKDFPNLARTTLISYRTSSERSKNSQLRFHTNTWKDAKQQNTLVEN